MEVVRGQRQYKGRASAGSGQSEGRAIEWRPKKRGQGQYRGRDPTPSFAAAREPYPSRGREDCYNVVTRAPTVGNDSVVPDSKRERGVHARAMLFWVLAGLAVVGALAIDWGLYLLVRRWL